jgi:Fe-S-cluster-containing dehydrogenase component
LCEHRLSKSLEPACTLVCPTGAIRFGGIHGLTRTLGKRRAKISTP